MRLRWLTLQISLPAAAKQNDLQQMLLERIEQLQADVTGVPLLVAWQVGCTGSLRFALEHESLANELITKLRRVLAISQHPFGHYQSQPPNPIPCLPRGWPKKQFAAIFSVRPSNVPKA